LGRLRLGGTDFGPVSFPCFFRGQPLTSVGEGKHRASADSTFFENARGLIGTDRAQHHQSPTSVGEQKSDILKERRHQPHDGDVRPSACNASPTELRP
jgi:hypothetical protein